MWPRVGPLLRKELRQVRRNRGALMSATLLPLLLLVIVPGFQLFSIDAALNQGLPTRRLPASVVPAIFTDPRLLVARFLFPLFLILGGMIIPGVAATHTVVSERERRSLELLVALPVRVGDILSAKLLAMLVLTSVVVMPLFAIDAAALMRLGYADWVDIGQLFAALTGSLTYAIGEALLVALLARDLRTAQNLNGALLVPVMALAGALLVIAPVSVNVLAAGALLFTAGVVCIWIGQKWLTFERYLS